MSDLDHGIDASLDLETYHALVRSYFGQYNLQQGDRKSFKGVFRPRSISGLLAVEVGCNSCRWDRAMEDIRRDDRDWYALFFPICGRFTSIQNDRTVPVTTGGCALTDTARPISYIIAGTFARGVALLLPRRPVVTQLGLEPQGNFAWGNDVAAARLLARLVLETQDEDEASFDPGDHYMQLAICDLLGAMLASSDLLTYSSHNEKMFNRINDIVRSRFSDPGIRPRDVASEAGISLRYLQKLFTSRGTTCGRFIRTLRLDHAARLLQLRNITNSGQPLGDIAYACGFQDYPHFVRAFHDRFRPSAGGHDVAATRQ